MSTPVTDPRNSPYCWSAAEVGTPDGTIRELACGRRRHRWGRHTNRHVTWKCPKRCVCVRHANRKKPEVPETVDAIHFRVPVTDSEVVNSASPEVSVLANTIGYALAERGVKFTADDAIAAAQRIVDQGLAGRGNG